MIAKTHQEPSYHYSSTKLEPHARPTYLAFSQHLFSAPTDKQSATARSFREKKDLLLWVLIRQFYPQASDLLGCRLKLCLG